MEPQYPELGALLLAAARERGIETARELHVALGDHGCAAHLNMVRRWLAGRARPRGARLESLLDVLGVRDEWARRYIRELAYVPQSERRSA